jgi:transposase
MSVAKKKANRTFDTGVVFSSNDFAPQFKSVVGLDVHRDTIVACSLRDVDGKNAHEIKTFKTFKKDIVDLSKWMLDRGVEKAVIESTGIYWQNPYHILQGAGIDIMLVNARHIRKPPGNKTDVEDARWLAMQARGGLVHPSRVLSRSLSELRELSRIREKRVQDRTSDKNRVYKLLVGGGFNVSQVLTDLFGRTGQIIIDGLLAEEEPPFILEMIKSTMGYRLKAPKEVLLDALEGKMSDTLKYEVSWLMDSISQKSEAIKACEDKLESELYERGHGAKLELLQTIPGVSKIASMTLLVELGCDLSAFPTASHLAKWAGMAPGNHESAGTRRKCGTTPGNVHLKRILCEVANAAAHTECYFRQRHRSLTPRCGHRRAVMANGCKLLKIIWHMLTKNEPYRDRSMDYESLVTKKNASRWLKNLRKYGHLEPAAKS